MGRLVDRPLARTVTPRVTSRAARALLMGVCGALSLWTATEARQYSADAVKYARAQLEAPVALPESRPPPAKAGKKVLAGVNDLLNAPRFIVSASGSGPERVVIYAGYDPDRHLLLVLSRSNSDVTASMKGVAGNRFGFATVSLASKPYSGFMVGSSDHDVEARFGEGQQIASAAGETIAYDNGCNAARFVVHYGTVIREWAEIGAGC